MHQLDLVDPDIILDLILQANDVKQNPGPLAIQDRSSRHKVDKLEKTISDLQKEIRTMHKVIEHQTTQILNLSRHNQKSGRVDEILSRLNHEVFELRENLDCQVSLMRRQRADMVSIGNEVKAVKKLNQNQRNELKHVSTVTIADVKNLKQECTHNLKFLQQQKQGSEEYCRHYSQLQQACAVLHEDQASIKKDLGTFRDSHKQQILSVSQCVEALAKDVQQHKSDAANRQRGLEGGINRLLEESTVSKSLILRTMQEAEDKKRELEEFRHLTSIDIERLRLESQRESAVRKEELESIGRKMDSLEEVVVGQTVQVDKVAAELTLQAERLEKVAALADAQTLEQSRIVQEIAGNANSVMSVAAQSAESALANIRQEQQAESERLSNLLRETLKADATRTEKIVRNLSERMDDLDGMYDDIEDRVFEIDKNRKNNLVFYGVRGEETDGDECERNIKAVMNTHLNLTREIPLTKVTRVWNGPSFRGVKPVQVGFQLFRDKEEVLRKAHLLKGTNMYVTEDFSRKVRKHREELIKFAREVRCRDPTRRCVLQYDRLYVEHEVYLYNEVERKVEKVLMRIHEGESGNSSRRKKRDQALPTSHFFQGSSSASSQGIQSTFPDREAQSRIPRWQRPNSRDLYGNGDGLSSSSLCGSSSDDDDEIKCQLDVFDDGGRDGEQQGCQDAEMAPPSARRGRTLERCRKRLENQERRVLSDLQLQ